MNSPRKWEGIFHSKIESPKRKKKGKVWHGISCRPSSSEIHNSRGVKTDPRDPWPHIFFSIWGLYLHQRTARAPFHGVRVFSAHQMRGRERSSRSPPEAQGRRLCSDGYSLLVLWLTSLPWLTIPDLLASWLPHLTPVHWHKGASGFYIRIMRDKLAGWRINLMKMIFVILCY